MKSNYGKVNYWKWKNECLTTVFKEFKYESISLKRAECQLCKYRLHAEKED